MNNYAPGNICPHLLSLIPFLPFPNSLTSGFCPHHTTKTAPRVTNDLHVTESSVQVSVFISLDLLAEFIQLFMSSIEFLHIQPKDTFLCFFSYLTQGSFLAFFATFIFLIHRCWSAPGLRPRWPICHSLALSTTFDDYQIYISSTYFT